MPIISHPACVHPPDDTVICRFLDFPKFRDLFANGRLYLRRTDLFKETDPNEALASDGYVRAARGLRRYNIDDEVTLNNDQAFSRQVSESYFINCWQLFEGETLEMWKTYGQGVAVFSSVGLLKSALAPMLDDILLGIVRYGEKDMTGYNLIQFLFTNRMHLPSRFPCVLNTLPPLVAVAGDCCPWGGVVTLSLCGWSSRRRRRRAIK